MPRRDDPEQSVVEPGRVDEWAEVRRFAARALLKVFTPTVALTSVAAVILSSIPPIYPERLISACCFVLTIFLPWWCYRRGY